MQDFKQLHVWQNAHQLTLEVYKATKVFPRDEIYGLTSQMRRCTVSVESNIAEGCGRGGNTELAHFLHLAMGSASELECQLVIARDLGYLAEKLHQELDARVTEVKRMLASLIQPVRNPAN